MKTQPYGMAAGMIGWLLAGCAPTTAWTSDTTAPITAGGTIAHGYFKARPVSVTATGLAEHRMVRLRFKLILKGTWDGNKCGWGPDLLGCRVRDGESLFLSSFSTAGAGSRHFTQSFPDDFPWANHLAFTGATPLADKPFRVSNPEHKAAFSDCAYAIDVTLPHRGDRLTLDFCPLFTDPDTDNQFWAVADFRCEPAPDPVAPDPATLEALWETMAAPDAPQASAAMWRFVAAGEHAAPFLLTKYAGLGDRWSDVALPPYNTPAALRLNRLQHALRLIATPETRAAADGMTYKIAPHEVCGETVCP